MAEASDAAPKTVSRAEAREMIEAGAQLIDVRADHEWEAGRIAGATHLPLAELAQRAGVQQLAGFLAVDLAQLRSVLGHQSISVPSTRKATRT